MSAIAQPLWLTVGEFYIIERAKRGTFSAGNTIIADSKFFI